MNLKQKINKLQLALKQKGKIVVINQRQIYSEEHDRFSTKYTIKAGGKSFDYFSVVDVVKKLSEMHKELVRNE